MGAQYSLKCDRCGFHVTTSGPWEFYRDEKGRRKKYGHPTPASEEAAEAGIYGLYGNLYCRQCGRTYQLILTEFKKPSRNALDVWSGQCEPKGKYQEEGAVHCPECGREDLVLRPHPEERFPCPACEDGTLTGTMDWIS